MCSSLISIDVKHTPVIGFGLTFVMINFLGKIDFTMITVNNLKAGNCEFVRYVTKVSS